MLVIGLTGNFGSGKSTVARLFARRGLQIVSCDRIVSALLKTEPVKKKVIRAFGKEVAAASGAVAKKKLAGIVFSSAAERKKLNSLIHPLVFARLKKILDRFSKGNKIILVEIPLLFETKSAGLFDVIVTVSAPPGVVKKRLSGKYSEAEAEKRWNSQLSTEEKEKKSDYVIDNGGSLRSTAREVEQTFQKILEEKACLKN